MPTWSGKSARETLKQILIDDGKQMGVVLGPAQLRMIDELLDEVEQDALNREPVQQEEEPHS